MPLDRFQSVVETLKERRLSNDVRNDAGYFVSLLKLEVDEIRRARAAVIAAIGEPQVESGIERIKRTDPARYVRAMLDSGVFDLEAFLAEYVDDELERARLRKITGAA